MEQWSLNGIWSMSGFADHDITGKIPGSVYSFLLDAGEMDDPYYRDNELKALALMDRDYTFSRKFDLPENAADFEHLSLRFDGIDTLSDVTLNGVLLGSTDNMHIAYEYPVKSLLKEKDNLLSVTTHSPVNYIREQDQKHHLGGSYEAMRGFPHLRKAHCMFGWDWGPRLPDEGIWKDVQLIGWNGARIEDVRIHEEYLTEDGIPLNEAADGGRAAREGRVSVYLTVNAVTACADSAIASSQNIHAGSACTDSRSACAGSPEASSQSISSPCTAPADQTISITLTSPDGESLCLENGVRTRVPNPKLWWPNGLGDQPLYTLKVTVCAENNHAGIERAETDRAEADLTGTGHAGTDCAETDHTGTDTDERILRIGLRDASVLQRKDEWGESFAAIVNGLPFFSMGADYIPEDNILSRRSRERTRKLLASCKDANFNVIRVWGGGYYPDDDFFDLCDEMGFLVWQDLMFACANYRLTDAFVKSITEEIRQNARRLRHHASLLLWCGNNEMEQFALERGYEGNDETAADYLIQNEYIIPEILKEEDPDRFYWPSSPSSGGKFVDPRDPDRGDVHYWEVWHGGVPFTGYREFYFRYLSEFGFQSFPCMETIRSFTLPEDRNIFSYVMEMHQRNSGANGKILQYLSQNYLYPTDFDTLIYASQLLQADAIRYGVEHLRRNRGGNRCMGAVYWQLNDIWPVASWASVDYFGRWKALHYSAKRFFAPVLLSCEEESLPSMGRTCISEPEKIDFKARLSISNETWDTAEDTVIWEIRDPDGNVFRSGSFDARTEPFSAEYFPEIDLTGIDPARHHLAYHLENGDSSGSVLFIAPKHYRFADPKLSVSVSADGSSLTVTAAAYARSVEIRSEDADLLLEDNYFDMEPGTRVLKILSGKASGVTVRSVYDIK